MTAIGITAWIESTENHVDDGLLIAACIVGAVVCIRRRLINDFPAELKEEEVQCLTPEEDEVRLPRQVFEGMKETERALRSEAEDYRHRYNESLERERLLQKMLAKKRGELAALKAAAKANKSPNTIE